MSAVTCGAGGVTSCSTVGFESVVACMFFVLQLNRTNAKPAIQGIEGTDPGELKKAVGSIPTDGDHSTFSGA